MNKIKGFFVFIFTIVRLYFTENNLKKALFFALMFTLFAMIVGFISQSIFVWMVFILGITAISFISVKMIKHKQRAFHKTIRAIKLETMEIDKDDPDYDKKEVDFTIEEQDWIDREDRKYRSSIIMGWVFIILTVVILFSLL